MFPKSEVKGQGHSETRKALLWRRLIFRRRGVEAPSLYGNIAYGGDVWWIGWHQRAGSPVHRIREGRQVLADANLFAVIYSAKNYRHLSVAATLRDIFEQTISI